MPAPNKAPRFLLCLRNDGCDDLELRKLYRSVPDKRAEREGYVRVVDESGEDYLYPSGYFVSVTLPRKAQAAMALSS
jgi:hypothetical protein